MSSEQIFNPQTYNLENEQLINRYNKTIKFLTKNVNKGVQILDLGIPNMLSEIMKDNGYVVSNTPEGIDLDDNTQAVKDEKYEVVTAFEIFEHLVNPYGVLKDIKAKYLVASVPLKLWFKNAYWNENDPWDRHYHEFEPRQFDMLLKKAGWKIVDSELWKSYSKKIGVRPFLRRITPRYYIVFCERI